MTLWIAGLVVTLLMLLAGRAPMSRACRALARWRPAATLSVQGLGLLLAASLLSSVYA